MLLEKLRFMSAKNIYIESDALSLRNREERRKEHESKDINRNKL